MSDDPEKLHDEIETFLREQVEQDFLADADYDLEMEAEWQEVQGILAAAGLDDLAATPRRKNWSEIRSHEQTIVESFHHIVNRYRTHVGMFSNWFHESFEGEICADILTIFHGLIQRHGEMNRSFRDELDTILNLSKFMMPNLPILQEKSEQSNSDLMRNIAQIGEKHIEEEIRQVKRRKTKSRINLAVLERFIPNARDYYSSRIFFGMEERMWSHEFGSLVFQHDAHDPSAVRQFAIENHWDDATVQKFHKEVAERANPLNIAGSDLLRAARAAYVIVSELDDSMLNLSEEQIKSLVDAFFE